MSLAFSSASSIGVERQDREHRPEDLVLDDLAVLGAVGDDRRAVEGAVGQARARPGRYAAGHDPRAGRTARSTKPSARATWVSEMSVPMSVVGSNGSPTRTPSNSSAVRARNAS